MCSQKFTTGVSLHKLTVEVVSPKTHVIESMGTWEPDVFFVDFITISRFPIGARVVPKGEVVGTVIR